MVITLELSDSSAVSEFLSNIEEECGEQTAKEIEKKYLRWGVVSIEFDTVDKTIRLASM